MQELQGNNLDLHKKRYHHKRNTVVSSMSKMWSMPRYTGREAGMNKILEYIHWWFPILALSTPIIWAVIYHVWYVKYREQKEKERWERIQKFFDENADKYPEAAKSFQLARFWASKDGYDLMHTIKTAEYKEQQYPRRKGSKRHRNKE